MIIGYMPGGILDLVSKGKEDIIIKNPEITFFISVIMKHNPFTIQPITQKFKSSVNFNKRTSCNISIAADLINKITLAIELPSITLKNKFAWVSNIGFRIIDYIEIEIAGTKIDRQYGKWLDIWYSLTKEDYQRYDKIIGNTKILTDFTYSKPNYKLLIPLQFWFNRFINQSLPIVCLQNVDININLSLLPIEDCIHIANKKYNISSNAINLKGNTNLYQDNNKVLLFLDYSVVKGIASVCVNSKIDKDRPIFDNCENAYIISKCDTKCEEESLENINIVDGYLIVDYIYLDKRQERIMFEENRNEYLIEQLWFQNKKVFSHDIVPLDLKFCCKYIIWNILDDKPDNLVNIKQNLFFNDNKDIFIDNYSYYNSINPYKYCRNTPDYNINLYSFSDNFDKMNKSHMGYRNLLVNGVSYQFISDKFKELDIDFYAVSYNLLRIEQGAASLVFI